MMGWDTNALQGVRAMVSRPVRGGDSARSALPQDPRGAWTAATLSRLTYQRGSNRRVMKRVVTRLEAKTATAIQSAGARSRERPSDPSARSGRAVSHKQQTR